MYCYHYFMSLIVMSCDSVYWMRNLFGPKWSINYYYYTQNKQTSVISPQSLTNLSFQQYSPTNLPMLCRAHYIHHVHILIKCSPHLCFEIYVFCVRKLISFFSWNMWLCCCFLLLFCCFLFFNYCSHFDLFELDVMVKYHYSNHLPAS